VSPFFILPGGNQPSSNPVHLANGRRSRDYVMFAVLAFPCNQFGKQEPGNAEEIANFAHLRRKLSGVRKD